jgi:hypothetical protein
MWYKIMVIKEWFGEMSERYKLVRDFNKAAKYALFRVLPQLYWRRKLLVEIVHLSMNFRNG